MSFSTKKVAGSTSLSQLNKNFHRVFFGWKGRASLKRGLAFFLPDPLRNRKILGEDLNGFGDLQRVEPVGKNPLAHAHLSKITMILYKLCFFLLPPVKITFPLKMHLVLFEPEIPHNTGAAGRLALATNSTLHLIRPLGFSLDEKSVRRAGLDYWKEVKLHVWENFPEFLAAHPKAQLWFLTTKAERSIWETPFQEDDFLVFGPETRGLPESLRPPDSSLRIPMHPDSTRSLNLATSIAIVLYEAQRQIGALR